MPNPRCQDLTGPTEDWDWQSTMIHETVPSLPHSRSINKSRPHKRQSNGHQMPETCARPQGKESPSWSLWHHKNSHFPQLLRRFDGG